MSSEVDVESLGRWNATSVSLPGGLLHGMFERMAEACPDAVAVVAGDIQLSYRCLEERANQMARHLLGLGVGVDSVVGVGVPRSVELLIALLGVLKAGAAYLPLDPELPEARLRQIVEQSGARVCVVDAQAAARLDGVCRTVVDRDWPLIVAERTDRPVVDVEAGNLVSVYFTSGSTGVPKGVCNTHGGWVNRMAWMQREFGLAAGESVLHKTILTFGDAGLELFWPLSVGGRVAMLAPGLHRDPAAIMDGVARHRSVYLQIVPSMLTMILDVVEREGAWRISSLRDTTSTGEALSSELVRRFFWLMPGALHNTWGATEVSIDSTHHRCVAEDGKAPGAVCVGRPFDNNEVYVLDADLRPVGVGVVGDLYIGGTGLARGYLADPARTAEVFLPNPFVPGQRMYSTGDCGSFREDGGIRYAGRRDNQVKIRGMRVELGEVESALRRHPAVAEAAALVREDVPGRSDLVGYVTLKDTAEVTVGDLLARVARELPDHMVPRFVVVLPEFPLNANLKIDRRALPAPGYASDAPRAGYAEPETVAERLVLEVFRTVLGIGELGVEDDFFTVGYSLIAVRVIARLRELTGQDLPLTLVYENRTARALAALIEERGIVVAPAGSPVIRRRPAVAPAPLSAGQEQLWFLHELAPDQPLYNEPAAHVLSGPLNVPALVAALRAVVGGHGSLRTAFVLEGDRPVQVVHDDVTLDVPVIDRTSIAADDSALLAELTELARTPFDLTKPCQLVARLYRLGDEEHVLFLNLHHIITDGWSSSVFAEQTARFYRAALERETPVADPADVEFADFAYWQRDRLTEGLDDQLSFWRTELAGVPTSLSLPSDRPRPAETRHSRSGARHAFELDASTSARLRDLAAETGSSAYLVMLAAFLLVLHRKSGQDDLIVGTPMANRGAPELDRLIGYFANIVPIRSRYTAVASFADHLERVRGTVLAAGENQDVPFEHLARAALPDDGAGSAVQVAFAYQHDFDLALRLPGVGCRSTVLDTGMARYDLTCLVTETAGRTLDCVLEFATDMFERETVARLAGSFTTVLVGVLDDPGRPLADYQVVSPRERALFAQWNATSAPVPDGGLHELFEWSVEVHPDAVAVVCGDAQLSYRCLDEHANRIAHHLLGLGLAPDDVVAVCVPRSVELLAVLLGVLKAGAAFLPLDGELPAGRLGQVLEQAGVRVCVADEESAGLFTGLCRTVVLERDRDLIAREPADRPAVAVAAKNLVSVYFTSGSTGVPKGVASTHGGWVNRMARMQREFGLSAGESVLQKTVLTFDDAGLELFWPLSVGGRVVMLGASLHRDPAAVLDGVGRYRSVYLQVVPSMLTMVLDLVDREGPWWVSSLRDTTSSGEALPAELVRRFFALVPGSLHNTWGATEVSIDSTHHQCVLGDGDGSGVVCVGKPFDNNEVYVLDAGLSPVGVGTVGALYIGGLGLARGYVADPARTAEAFLPNPFVPGERMYYTGDRGSFRADDGIRYAGRRDNQVKIRGMRVELGEVEAALRRHPLVREAVAIIHGGRDANVQRLVAFVTPASAAERLSAEEIRSFVVDWLPRYMVPSLILVEDRLPHNANGKVDRAALVVPEQLREHTSMSFVPCEGPAEEAIAEILCELLGLPEVGAMDNFFELGAHSLVLSRLAARLRQRFEVLLPLRAIFDYPTVRGLAGEVGGLLVAKIENLSPDEMRALLDSLN